MPHPKTDFSKKSYCIPMNNPMDQVYKKIIFRTKSGIATILGSETPSIRNQVSGNVLPLS